MEFTAGDRVLAIDAKDDLRDIASRVSLVVGIVDPGDVHDTRAALRDCENVMVVPSDPEGAMPWKEEFFSVVYAPSAVEPTSEMLRVLARGGIAVLSGGPVQKR